MSITFSNSGTSGGIVEQTRSMIGLDSTQWPVANIVNSTNNWLDYIAGYAIGADRRFQWDDTNHTKLPEGTTNLVSGQSDYSFLTDEQSNPIVTLLGVSLLTNGYYFPLANVDRNDNPLNLNQDNYNLIYNQATFGQISGTPTAYDKIADNIIRLDFKPSSSTTNGLKFYFQRTPSYFTSADTTKTPGVSPLLHRGFIIASAYDCALTLGLPNLQALAAERQLEQQKVVTYFAERNNDDSRPRMTMAKILYI